MTFQEHKEQTAADCESFAKILTDLAVEVKNGDIKAFERFWIENGTEEGDPKIITLWENLVLRYSYREKQIEK